MRFLTLLLLTTLLFANPKPYAQLGDLIYDTTVNFKRLPKLESDFDATIDAYIERVKAVKSLGYSVMEHPKNAKKYLRALRALDKERERLLDKLNGYLYDAIDRKDCATFNAIIDADLLDLYRIADDAAVFYNVTCKRGSRVMDEYIAEQRAYRAIKKERQKNWARWAEKRRIERIHEAAKEAEKKRVERFDKEVEQQKRRINEKLESELIR